MLNRGCGGPRRRYKGHKTQRLRTSAADSSISADALKAKILAYQDARAKVHSDLLAAQKKLETTLSPRQEAKLMAMGLID